MLKLTCFALLCAIVIVQCQDAQSPPTPAEEDSHEEGPGSDKEHGGFGRRRPPMRGKPGYGRLSQNGDGNNNDDDVNVNVNVHLGSGAQARPQWFGDRPHRGPPGRGNHGGKGPRPPRQETNGTRPDGQRPPPSEGNATRPDREESEENDHDHRRPGGKYGRGGKYGQGFGGPNNERANPGDDDVNVNVNVQVSRGNGQGNGPQGGGFGRRRPQIGGKGGHGPHKPEGPRGPPKSEEGSKTSSPPPEADDSASSEQNE